MEKVIQRTCSKIIHDPRLLDLSREAASCYNLALNTYWSKANSGEWLDKYELQKEMRGKFKRTLLHSDSYLGALQQFSNAVSCYFKAKKSFEKDPYKFSGKPKPPQKEKEQISIFFKQSAIYVKDGFLILSLAQGNEPIKTRWNIKLGIPKFAVVSWDKNAGWKLNLIVEKIIQTNEDLDENKSIGIDLGVKRIAATCDDNGKVILYSGKEIKSLIRLRERRKAKVESRCSQLKKHGKQFRKIKRSHRKIIKRINDKIKDVLHKTSRTIVNYCQENKIGKATIGECSSIHKNTNLGEKNNQAINQSPEQTLAKYFQYKFEDIGGETKFLPESYTSKTCPKCGQRKKPTNRTFKCKCGFKYDRDGVGSLNIWGLGKNVSLGGALAILSVVGSLTDPIGWKFHPNRDCLAEVKTSAGRTPRF